MGQFETSLEHQSPNHRPIAVPARKGDIFGAAKEMCADLDGWEIIKVEEESLTLHCRRKNGLLGGTSEITVRVEGPDDLPSSTTYVSSSSSGGLLSKDKGIVGEFVKRFTMRIC